MVTSEAVSGTPLRRTTTEERDGCRLLREPSGTYSDGGEAAIAAILAGAEDLSSLSDELASAADGWVERYHLSLERANILRPLEIGRATTVLELGAGCGAVSRLLGERGGAVDAVEPSMARARCARLRTRDLDSVEVFVGELADVPSVPAYDLVAIIGVLEYVDGDEARRAFIRDAAARLRPGGSLVLAIENKLGVKYLAGAPEDHSGRPFEGVEGYPHRDPFATFSRRALEAMFRDAGLQPAVYHAFPDYKLTRLVYADALLDGPAASLAWRVPRFPSEDPLGARPRLASERRVWRELVQAGLGAEFANSFLVIGRAGDGHSPWPENVQGVFYATKRRARFATETRIEPAGDGLMLCRRHLTPGPDERVEGALAHRRADAPFVPGTSLLEQLEQADAGQLAPLLTRWREHVVDAIAQSPEAPNLDVAPDNVVVTAGGPVSVDDEWRSTDYDATAVLARCLLHTAALLADLRPPEQWPAECETVGELAAHLAGLAGARDAWDAGRLAPRESELQAQVTSAPPDGERWDAAVAAEAAKLAALLSRPLADSALGAREWEQRAELQRHSDQQHERILELDTSVEPTRRLVGELGAELERLNAAHRAVIDSRSWRLTAPVRRAARRLQSD